MHRMEIEGTVIRTWSSALRGMRAFLTIPWIAAISFFLLIVSTAGRYGFFGDELYYIACSKHLAFGYVDHPPLVALLTLVSRSVFGESLLGLRVISGMAGALTVLWAARLAQKLGGGPFAQAVASLSICFATAFPALSSFYSMNAIDITLATLLFVLLADATKDPTPSRWIFVGLVFGLGALNKYTFLVLGFSFVVSLVVTRRWSILKNPWIYVGGTVGALLFLPHVMWQIAQGWPTLEFMRNATEHKNLSLTLTELGGQLLIGLNPLTFPLWTVGLGALVASPALRSVRFLGWMALIFLAVYGTQSSKFYYVIPIFPLLLSAGALQAEQFLMRLSRPWFRWALLSPIALTGCLLMPLAVPLLPPDQFITYSKALGLWNAIRMERWEGDTLPLHFLFRFGWEELVEDVAVSYQALTAQEQKDCVILTSWYAPAAAVDFYGPRHKLPSAISPHNSYWLWGPGNGPHTTVLAIGFDRHQLEEYFESVELVRTFSHPYALSQPLYVCKHLRKSVDEIWISIKAFG
jgi:4-amino-4-deoxy-L-arabinose transferase-like glycosyltransferase